MANNNIPPSWANRDLSAKPNWNNQKAQKNKEIAQTSSLKESPCDDANREKVALEDPKSELPEEKTAGTSDETISTSLEADESVSTQESARRSKKLIIIIVIVLVILIASVCVLTALYFTSNTTKEQGDSISTNSTDISTETTSKNTTTTISTTSTTTTTATTETTTTLTTTTIMETTAAESFAEDSIGYWHDTDYGYTRELTISQVDDDTITFTLWYLDTDSIENVIAVRNGDTATFSAEDVEGSISFEEGIITVEITQSKRAYMPSEVMTFNARHDHSWEYDGYDINDNGNDYSGIVYVNDADVTIYDSPNDKANAIGTLEAGNYYTIVDGYYDTELFCTYLKLESDNGWIYWDYTNVEYYYVYCTSCGYYFSPSDSTATEAHCPVCGNDWILE